MAAKQPDCRQDLKREAVVSTGGRERGREGARVVRHKAVGPDRNAQGVIHSTDRCVSHRSEVASERGL
jgi:hypothetical protein